MDDSRIRTAAELISALISPKAAEAAGTWAKVTGAWPALAGDRAAPHSRIADLENHVVTVEVDHPGWIQLLQFRQVRLLTEIQERFPSLEVRALQFRLARRGGPGPAGAADGAGRGGSSGDTGRPADRNDAGPGTVAGHPEGPESPPPAAPLRLDPEAVGDEALRKALSGLRDAYEGR